MKHRKRHLADVVHHTKGRIRIRVHSAKGDTAALEEICRGLASVHGVRKVEVNPSIGSITICYDPALMDFERHLAEEHSQSEVSIASSPKLNELARLDQMIENEAAFLAGHSYTGKMLMDFLNRLDRQVKILTGNSVDMKVVAPLALAIAAFVELGVAAATPVWLTLGLFSFNHLIEINSHSPGGNPSGEPQPPRGDTPSARRQIRTP